MTIPQAEELFKYWAQDPPEHELLGVLAAYEGAWQPAERQYASEEEKTAAHRESLERRWASGQYMNPKQMYESIGGKRTVPAGTVIKPEDRPFVMTPDKFPGIGPFPGAH